MEQRKEITTKDILVLLPLSILSFADPITDILTLTQYYNAGHKIWFRVALVLIIFPCFAFMLYSCATYLECSRNFMFNTVCPVGIHPFSASFLRLEAFVACSRKKICRGEIIAEGDHEYKVLQSAKLCSWFEALTESAPQFLIQLYVASTLEEPVSAIQVISLTVSFLNLVWCFQAWDEEYKTDMACKHKFALFITHLLLLSARLFAITYFIVAFKWWYTGVVFLHFIFVAILYSVRDDARDIIENDESTCAKLFSFIIISSIIWLGYETFNWPSHIEPSVERETAMKTVKKQELFTYILTVLENILMILLYYFLFLQNSWYSLLVTVCVCSFSVVGAIIKLLYSNLFLHRYEG